MEQPEEDLREEARPALVEEVRGVITASRSNLQKPFLLWDVSDAGIGIWTDWEFHRNTNVVVTISQPHLLLLKAKVIWSEKQGGSHGFRVGLKIDPSAKNTHASLKSIFNDMVGVKKSS